MARFLKLFFPVIAVLFLVAFFGLKHNESSAQTLVCGNADADVVILIDKSGSMDQSAGASITKMEAAKQSANVFVDLLSNNTANRAGVVSFGGNPVLRQTLTSNFQAAKDAINSINSGGGTCTECGAYTANQDIKNNGRAGIKKVVVLLTDGKANVVRGSTSQVGTNLAEEQALEEIELGHQESGTVYFTIGLGNEINEAFLQEIASITGGEYFASPTTNELNSIYQEISQIIAEGSISGVVYNDLNKNGTKDDGEENLSDWTIRLEQSGFPTKSSVTDDAGGYTFGALCDGSYTVSQILQSNWEQTEPINPSNYSINLTSGATLTSTNFGNAAAPTPTSVPQCIKATPTLEITPDTITGEAGVEQVFDVTITNNDSSECQPSTFNISGVVFNFPLWDITLDQEEFILSPGEEGNTKMRVTPPSDEQNGTKTITVILQKVDGPQITQNVFYAVQNPPDPTATDTPTPTNSPTPTLTPTATPTITPTNTPTPTPTPGPTVLNLTVGADGIGTTPRIPLGGNKNPLHPNRNFLVSLFNAGDNTPVFSGEQTFTYNPIDQKFISSFTLPGDFITGVYNLFVEGPQYLRAGLPGSANITQGNVINIVNNNFNLIAGDINKNDMSFNSIDLLDYNVLISCSIYSQSSTACEQDENYSLWSDLDDNGIVDEDDYTLWLKELANQPGAALPGN